MHAKKNLLSLLHHTWRSEAWPRLGRSSGLASPNRKPFSPRNIWIFISKITTTSPFLPLRRPSRRPRSWPGSPPGQGGGPAPWRRPWRTRGRKKYYSTIAHQVFSGQISFLFLLHGRPRRLQDRLRVLKGLLRLGGYPALDLNERTICTSIDDNFLTVRPLRG